MQIISYTLGLILVFNLILIFSFLVGKFFIFNSEKKVILASKYSIYIAVIFIIYFISIIAFDCLSFLYVHRNICYALSLSIFLFTPFIIGNIAKYEKINFYTNIQILTLVISLILGILIFLKLIH